jgi:soluble lytic murein transglycosylase
MVNALGRHRLAIGIFATAALGLAMALPQVMSPRANDAVDPTVTGSIRSTPSVAETGVSSTFRQALALVADGKAAEGYALARGIADATERRAVQWAAITFGNGEVPSDAMERFAADAPDFVKTSSFRSRLEQALVKEEAAAPEVIAALGGATPNTIDGQIALATAYRAAGEVKRATAIARSLWVNNFLERATEDKVLAQLGDLLDREAHWDRAVHLMMHDRASAVERLFDKLTPAQKSLAVARNATSRNDKDAKKLLDSVDPAMTDNPVFYFSRAQRARQFELWDDAIAWLDKAKGEVPDAAEFWYERRLLVRQLLALGEVKRAYRAAAGYTEGPEGRLVEAQFHAGWIALSFLRDPATAATHFRLMRENSTLPDSVTQADYWLGRALDASGDNAGARKAWADAGAYGTIYYGQLARAALGEPAVGLRPMPEWKPAEAGFEARELVRAVRLLADNGQKVMAATLLRSFAFDLQDGADLLQAARLAQSLGSHHLAISIADISERRGAPLDLFNFPKDGLPRQQLASIDHAAVYAVARQESRFQVDAVSSAGARGLMQLMPGTAKETAGKLGLDYSANRLTSDGAYNALLGSTYLKAQLDTFDGSLLLAAAAYNAGPGNVRKWLTAYGDPRSDKIDPVVWVELIPMLETRKYVQRVLGNYLVYRARLGLDELSMVDALRRIPG